MLGVTQILLTIFGVDTLLSFKLTLKPNVIMVPISYLSFLFYKTNHYIYIGFIGENGTTLIQSTLLGFQTKRYAYII
jgi:hypothetical protein